MPLVLITPPAVEPISLAEAKAAARCDNDLEDGLFALWIQGAREAAEHHCGRALIEQTWELRLDQFPACEIELPKPTVLSVISVKYDDEAGAEQTVAPGNYAVDAGTLPGWLLPAEGFSWPATAATANCVRVRFTAGYGATGAAVPAAVRQWMLLQVAAAYRNRESFVTGISATELPNRWVDGLLDRARTYL